LLVVVYKEIRKQTIVVAIQFKTNEDPDVIS